MDIILAIVKYLTATLTPVEFLVVLVLVGIVATYAVKFALKKKKVLASIFSSKDDDAFDAINIRLDNITTREEFNNIITSFEFKFEAIFRRELTEHARTDAREFERLSNALLENRSLILSDSLTTRNENSSRHDRMSEQISVILVSTNKLNDIEARVLSRIENVDEFLKASIPEFRGYHREMSSDIKLLNRDIALIEQSIQLQINTNNAIKLR